MGGPIVHALVAFKLDVVRRLQMSFKLDVVSALDFLYNLIKMSQQRLKKLRLVAHEVFDCIPRVIT